MEPRIRRLLASAVVLVLFQMAMGKATVIRDGKTGPVNPAVQAGGQRLQAKQPSNIPYSLIGAIRSDYQWFTPCFIWPWRILGAFPWHRQDATRTMIRARQPGRPPTGLPPPVP
jgi:hypothetical protein